MSKHRPGFSQTGQTGEATKEGSASDADDQQTPPSVTAKGQAPGMLMYVCHFLL